MVDEKGDEKIGLFFNEEDGVSLLSMQGKGKSKIMVCSAPLYSGFHLYDGETIRSNWSIDKDNATSIVLGDPFETKSISLISIPKMDVVSVNLKDKDNFRLSVALRKEGYPRIQFNDKEERFKGGVLYDEASDKVVFLTQAPDH